MNMKKVAAIAAAGILAGTMSITALAGCGGGLYADVMEGYKSLAVPEKRIVPDVKQVAKYRSYLQTYMKQAKQLGELYNS